MNHEFLENCMSDLHYSAPNSILHVGMTTQRPMPSMPRPIIGLSLCGTSPSFSTGRVWDTELPISQRQDTLLSFPSHQSLNEAFNMSNSSLTLLGQPSSPTSHASNTMGSTADIERPAKQQRIMPRSMNAAAEMTEIVGSKNASAQATKRAGRRGPFSKNKKAKISKMRRKMACSACYASHVEVSNHRRN